MKTSELIVLLQTLQQQFGDYEVHGITKTGAQPSPIIGTTVGVWEPMQAFYLKPQGETAPYSVPQYRWRPSSLTKI